MEPIPARILRPIAEACASAPQPTARQLQTRAYILDAARDMFAARGTPHIGIKTFAESCGLSVTTIRRHVCDMHYLFRLVLQAHLEQLLAAIVALPTAPGSQSRGRAEYRRLTTDHLGQLTAIHALFAEFRGALPKDQRDLLEAQRRMLGVLLAGDEAELALAMLDSNASLDRIEGMFASSPQTAEQRTEIAARAAPRTPPARPAFALSLQPPPAPLHAPIEAVLAASSSHTPPQRWQAA